MKRLPHLLLLAALLGGGWYFFTHYQVEGLERIAVHSKDDSGYVQQGAIHADQPPASGAIRVASFNIQVFGSAKLNKPRVTNVLAEIVRRFDVVAIQEIRATTDDLLPRFVDLVNSTGRHYDLVIGPRLGRTVSKEQYAFVYDTATIEVDRQALYTIKDPDNLLHRPPLVGWFRVRGLPTDQAFTFSLVNVHVDPDETRTELDALADAFRAVRDDGRGEDDVILLGDLNVDDHHLRRLGGVPEIISVISGVPTNTRGDKLYDNILFGRLATSEFTGRGGVFDMIREFNLTIDEALEVSDHMPIWAEFSAYEGGQSGRVAAREDASEAPAERK